VQFITQRNLREIMQLIAKKQLIADPMTTLHAVEGCWKGRRSFD
jgi:hypothetical protein